MRHSIVRVKSLAMKPILFHTSFLIVLLFSCGGTALSEKDPSQTPEQITPNQSLINPAGRTLESRFGLPPGFQRAKADSNSFAHYLRNLPLKPEGSRVKYYNGDTKNGEGVYAAVVDLPIGTKDLHQCADAVMRLWAEHLYAQKQYDKIHFNFSNGWRCDYSEWMKGKRVVVNGNSTFWKQSAQPSNTPKDFWNYLEMVFSYAGSLSLSKEMKDITVPELRIGDVFILGGSPGHAVIVVDVATSDEGRKIFMLAQSYMPAQETQILINPVNEKISPWYSVDFGETLHTPEWKFQRSELRRFQE